MNVHNGKILLKGFIEIKQQIQLLLIVFMAIHIPDNRKDVLILGIP
jgi:hypothetical protein